VTSGSGVVKYLCRGANFVGLGRIQVYGLAIGGEAGVVKTFQLLKEELLTCAANLGAANLEELDENFIFNGSRSNVRN
jgi:isopentenyl diphosphate isomerase/L-lactate dehydrogenase-like FMN-dependent dehydrogenase